MSILGGNIVGGSNAGGGATSAGGLIFDSAVTTALIGGLKTTDAGGALEALGANSISIITSADGSDEVAEGAFSIVAGYRVQAVGTACIVAGKNASSGSFDDNIVFGNGAVVAGGSAYRTLCQGQGAKAQGTNAAAYGANTKASGVGSSAIGGYHVSEGGAVASGAASGAWGGHDAVARTAAVATGDGSFQIGVGTNAVDDSLQIAGILGMKVFNQSAEPTTGDLPSGFAGFWTDTDDSKCYWCYNHGGTVKTVEMI